MDITKGEGWLKRDQRPCSWIDAYDSGSQAFWVTDSWFYLSLGTPIRSKPLTSLTSWSRQLGKHQLML